MGVCERDNTKKLTKKRLTEYVYRIKNCERITNRNRQTERERETQTETETDRERERQAKRRLRR